MQPLASINAHTLFAIVFVVVLQLAVAFWLLLERLALAFKQRMD